MWLKGNLHAHTTNSDGDSAPDTVAAWYRDHDYDFLAITDHNRFTEPASVSRAALGDMFLVPGEEITMPLGVHVNAINLRHEIPTPAPPWLRAAREVLTALRQRLRPDSSGNERWAKLSLMQAALRLAADQGALASVNHPNYRWALDAGLLEMLENLAFFEVHNAHPACYADGDAAHPSSDEIWDRLLCAGRRVYGLATDDSHQFIDWGPAYSNPGRGWVVVDAADRDARSVQSSLEAGRFYASTGVHMAGLNAHADGLELALETAPHESFDITFIAGGRVVERCQGAHAACTRPKDAPYLRAVVRSSSGARAWIQPVFA